MIKKNIINLISVYHRLVWQFPGVHPKSSREYVPLHVRLLSFRAFLRFIRVIQVPVVFSLLLSRIPLYEYHSFLIHSSNDRYLGCFPFFLARAWGETISKWRSFGEQNAFISLGPTDQWNCCIVC